jgi:transcriptional regulator with XRE-family HTH domain
MIIEKKQIAIDLGFKIRSIRLSKGLTMEELAALSGIEYVQISRIELGKINTTIFQIFRIANSLDISVAQIFATEENNTKSNNHKKIKETKKL